MGAQDRHGHNRWLRDFVHQRLESVDRAAVIDLHTGLGPWSHAELISSEPAGSAALARQRSWWGQITSLNEGTSVSAEITGECSPHSVPSLPTPS